MNSPAAYRIPYMSIQTLQKPRLRGRFDSDYQSADSQLYQSASEGYTDPVPSAPSRAQILRAERDREDRAYSNLLRDLTPFVNRAIARLSSSAPTKPPKLSKPPRVKTKKPKTPVVVLPAPVPVPLKVTASTGLPKGSYTSAPVTRVTVPPTTEKVGEGVVITETPGKKYTTISTVELPRITGPHIMTKAGRAAMKSVSTSRTTSRRGRPMVSVSAPASKGVRMNMSNRPTMRASGGSIIVHHKELMGSVVTSSSTNTYQCDSYVVNPGKSATFPWLSTLAGNFEKYRIVKLAISYVSNQPTTVAGKIGIGIDYDSTDPLPADRQEFFSLTHHQECSVWDSITFNVPVQGGIKFVNSHTTTDSKLIDFGQLLVFSDQYATASTSVGDLIVEYIVELMDPQQAIYNTMAVTGANAADVSSLTITGPVLAVRTSSTSTTVLELSFGTGYYYISSWVYDVTANTPTCTVTVLSGYGSGTTGGVGDTSNQFRDVALNVTKQNATVRFTFSESVALMEKIVISITRISATVYKVPTFAQTTSLGTH